MDLLADLQAAGVPCVGLSGVDAGLLKARRRTVRWHRARGTDGRRTTACVGDIESVDTRLLQHLRTGDYVPVVAPLAGDPSGTVYSASADTVAATLAVALAAEKLFFLLPTSGLLRGLERSGVAHSPGHADGSGHAGAGRARCPAACCRRRTPSAHALVGGVGSVHLVSGVLPNALLEEVFTNEGSGTMVVREAPARAGRGA